jgi:aerobic-type carbon monoxide dehydrogenase small subunit (CoxS/CutS family)
MQLEFTVNGAARRLDVEGERTLLEVLREDLGLTGTKYGCGEGDCRACTVLLDGEARPSCQVPIATVKGREVRTIESLAANGELHPVQRAFIAAGAMQCGYCVPGMILATVGLLAKNPKPDDDEIVEALNGNLCRCCGYVNVLNAARIAAGASARREKL